MYRDERVGPVISHLLEPGQHQCVLEPAAPAFRGCKEHESLTTELSSSLVRAEF